MKRGKGYSVNVPLRDGINDESFHQIFKPVSRLLRNYQHVAHSAGHTAYH